MKNVFHAIASVLFVAWIAGVAVVGSNPQIHYLLLGSIIAALITFLLYRSTLTKKKPKSH